MAKAKSKIIAGLEDAAKHASVERAVFDWIRDDAPVAIKMMMTRECCDKLVDRICGTKTHRKRQS